MNTFPLTSNLKERLLNKTATLGVIGLGYVGLPLADALQVKLKENDIPSMIYYIKPMHLQLAFADLPLEEGNFAVTNRFCETVLSLPMHPNITEEEITKVSDVIQEFMNA